MVNGRCRSQCGESRPYPSPGNVHGQRRGGADRAAQRRRPENAIYVIPGVTHWLLSRASAPGRCRAASSRSISPRVAVLSRNADRLALQPAQEPLPPGEDETALVDARLRQRPAAAAARGPPAATIARARDGKGNWKLSAIPCRTTFGAITRDRGLLRCHRQDRQGQLDAAGPTRPPSARGGAPHGHPDRRVAEPVASDQGGTRRTQVAIAASANAISASRMARPRMSCGYPHRARTHADADAELTQIARQKPLLNAWR